MLLRLDLHPAQGRPTVQLDQRHEIWTICFYSDLATGMRTVGRRCDPAVGQADPVEPGLLVAHSAAPAAAVVAERTISVRVAGHASGALDVRLAAVTAGDVSAPAHV